MEKQTILGFDFISAHQVEEVATILINTKEHNRNNALPFLITPNAAQIVEFEKKEKKLKEKLSKAAFILPDGQPIVWLSKMLGKPLKKRLTGSDLFPALWKLVQSESKRAYFIASHLELKERIEQEYPLAKVYVPPFFDAQDENTLNKIIAETSDEIVQWQPQFIFVGLGFPKQELISLYLYQKMITQTEKPLFLLLGASFEFYYQLKSRAPRWIQNIGFEWLYRFAQEPKRMWRRYTIGNIAFIIICLKELLKKNKKS
ncbi:MAG: glycosyltransferase [Cytophagales bacterium]|nr:MAG: glycosyltransferase [Cytophagales bacterium]